MYQDWGPQLCLPNEGKKGWLYTLDFLIHTEANTDTFKVLREDVAFT